MTSDPQIGDTVTVEHDGPWAGHTGTVTRIAESAYTDLRLYQVDPATDLFYADELAPEANR